MFISVSFRYLILYLVASDPPFPFVIDNIRYAQTIKRL